MHVNLYNLEKPEILLLYILKAYLQNRELNASNFNFLNEKKWDDIYFLSKRQGISCLIGDKLIKVSNLPYLSKKTKIKWALSIQKDIKRYSAYCQAASELTSLYIKYGIGTLQLKGVGFSNLYPNPEFREGGDIDIFTYSLAPNEGSDKNSNDYADLIMKRQGIQVKSDFYKHSSFKYHGIPIENHKCFLAFKHFPLATDMNYLLNCILFKNRIKNYSISGERTELLNGKYVVYTPSAEFNSIFLAFHALQHLGCGLTLHHIVDWAVLLQKFGWCMPKEVTDKGFLSFAYALNQLCKEWFGIDVGTPDVSEKAEIIAEEIFHPKYDYKKVPETSLSKILIYKVKRMLHEHWLKKQFLDISLTKRIFTSIFVHLKNPKLFSD